jgi:hypothetical protein
MKTNLQQPQTKQLFIYLVILILLYPIVAHMLMYEFDIFKDKLPHGPFWLFVQIFLSGPLLVLGGLILFFKGKSIGNRVAGVVLFIIGVYWLYRIIDELINKS